MWAETLYFRAKNAGKEPSELIWTFGCPYPRLAYAVNYIIHNIGFDKDVELQAALSGTKLQ